LKGVVKRPLPGPPALLLMNQTTWPTVTLTVALLLLPSPSVTV
jgi:hypothetical protein